MASESKAAGHSKIQVLLADLKACSKTQNLERGKQLHAEVVKCGYRSSVYVGNALINMYAKCGNMKDARNVFDSMKRPTVVSWTTLILGYADNGESFTALYYFIRMRTEGSAPDSATFVAIMKVCTSLPSCLDRGKQMHNLALENLCDSNMYVQSTLIDMYAKCGRMLEARQVFDSMKQPDVVSWNVLILGYADNGLIVLDLLCRMNREGTTPDSVTLVAALKACISLAVTKESSQWRDRGTKIHNLAVENGFDSEIYMQNTLIRMYAKFGNMLDACRVFDIIKHPDVVSLNALIIGYVENGQDISALDLFTKMEISGLAPDPVTFVSVLKACTSLPVKEASGWDPGTKIHNLAVEHGCDSNIYVQSVLIDMYGKHRNMVCARQVFDSIKHPDVVSWNVLILGYADNGQGLAALRLFMRMKSDGLSPDSITFSGALKACTYLGALELGRKVHSEMDMSKDLDVVLVNCLVDFYAKCGSLVEAQHIFDDHPETRNIVTWTAMLAGFSNLGDHESVFALFEKMQDAGWQPDSVIFLSILTCCSHGGLVDKGKEFFDSISRKYGISPTIENCNCMVDIFGRANRLDDAMALLQNMCCSPNDVTWTTILGACHKWKNVDIGRLAFQALINFNNSGAGYVLMGHIYGRKGMLQEQEFMMKMGAKLI